MVGDISHELMDSTNLQREVHFSLEMERFLEPLK